MVGKILTRSPHSPLSGRWSWGASTPFSSAQNLSGSPVQTGPHCSGLSPQAQEVGGAGLTSCLLTSERPEPQCRELRGPGRWDAGPCPSSCTCCSASCLFVLCHDHVTQTLPWAHPPHSLFSWNFHFAAGLLKTQPWLGRLLLAGSRPSSSACLPVSLAAVSRVFLGNLTHSLCLPPMCSGCSHSLE